LALSSGIHVDDMQAYFAEDDVYRRNEIAMRARHGLLDHMPKGSKLRLSEVKEVFDRMSLSYERLGALARLRQRAWASNRVRGPLRRRNFLLVEQELPVHCVCFPVRTHREF
jgi:hypothetical protein